MPGARHVQRDLFDEPIPTPELRSELRTKLAPLLQALLVEAAKVQRRRCEADLQIEEGGDDEDHA
ncbi:MAG: hypothetical protein WAK69_19450 [Rhodoplanes sp.]|jgi:hypothetical protein